jgi:hypothetical protein
METIGIPFSFEGALVTGKNPPSMLLFRTPFAGSQADNVQNLDFSSVGDYW